MSRSFRALPQKPTGPKPPRRGFLAAMSTLAVVPALAAEGVSPTHPLPARRSQPHSDADLIRICEGHKAVVEGLHQCNCMEDCAHWQAYERSRDAIHAAVPVTLAGMVAKARAAKIEALNVDGTENPDGSPAENWAWDLVNDILRLEGTL
jgi:hypothetical protein